MLLWTLAIRYKRLKLALRTERFQRWLCLLLGRRVLILLSRRVFFKHSFSFTRRFLFWGRLLIDWLLTHLGLSITTSFVGKWNFLNTSQKLINHILGFFARLLEVHQFRIKSFLFNLVLVISRKRNCTWITTHFVGVFAFKMVEALVSWTAI